MIQARSLRNFSPILIAAFSSLLHAQVRPPGQPANSPSDIASPAPGESPFVDLVRFRNQPRHPMATEHRQEPRPMGGGRAPDKVDYALGQFVPIIDRALNNNGRKLVLERSANGKWIAQTVTFVAQDHSFATPGWQYLGRIIASKPSEFSVTVSEDGLVTAKQNGSTDDLRGSGIGYPPIGRMTWAATETLDLNTGADNWTFESQMEGHYRGPMGPGVKATLTASDSVHRDITLAPGIDETRLRGDASAASDPANPRSLLIGDLKFRGAAGASSLRFTDHAVLSVTLVNHAGLDLNDLRYSVTTTEKNNGILDPGKLNGGFRIARDGQIELASPIATSFAVPAGGLNFVLTVSYKNAVLGRKTLAVPTEPFYRDAQVHLPEANAPRLRAVAKYFGIGGAASADPGPELSAAAAGGDPLAGMWEAVFYSQGVAGYTFDQDKAYRAARQALPRVEERARSGDAEGLYLLFYACQLGAMGEDAEAAAGQFLERAASAGFLPAKFDRARDLTFRKDYGNAPAALKEVYDAGVKKAAVILGGMYERGLGVERDSQAALKWDRLGADFGDPEAVLAVANLTATGVGDTPPDAAKAMQLAKQASARRYSGAYLFLGQAYASGRQGVKRDPAAAIKTFSTAADLGDRQAMLALGELYLGNAPGITPDERAGVFWIRKAAERGSPKAMLILSKCYNEGTLIEKDVIAARYWYNQAAVHGFVPADNRGMEAQRESFIDFWRYADFSPSYVYVNEYGGTVGDSGDGMLNGLFSGLFGAMTSYYGRQQSMIDGLELIQKRNGRKIYGGTVSSGLISKLQVKAGEIVSIRAYGIVSTGMFSGPANANGLGNGWPEYRVVKNLPTSSVIGRIGDAAWELVGTRARITASKDGPLMLAINAIDYRNYKGYFDLVVEVPDDDHP